MNSKTKKILLIVADVVLYLIGFPALLVIGYLASREFIAQGIYGIMAYVPIILAGLVMVVCGIVEIFFRASSKRTFAEGRKHRSNFKKQTLKMVIAVVACLCGFMVILDFALPGVLKDATQGTILYDDIVENYSNQNLVQKKLVDTFIELNVENGYLNEKAYKVIDKAVEDGTLTGNTAAGFKTTFDNLSKEFRGGTYMYPEEISTTSAWDNAVFAPIKDKKVDVLREYKAEAFANAEVKPLAKSIFYSIDAAYAAFDPLLIEVAQVDMNLVMASPDLIGKVLLAYVSDGQIRTKIVNGEKLTAVNSEQVKNATALENAGLDPEDEFLFKWNIMDMLGAVPESLLSVDLILTVFEIDPANPATNNARRGSLDYMSMAWLDSVSLLGIISIFSIRTWFFMFAGFIAVLTLLRGVVRINYKKISELGDPIPEVGEYAENESEFGNAPLMDAEENAEVKKEKKVKEKKVKEEKIKPEKIKPEKVKKKKGSDDLEAVAEVEAEVFSEEDGTQTK